MILKKKNKKMKSPLFDMPALLLTWELGWSTIFPCIKGQLELQFTKACPALHLTQPQKVAR